MKKLRIWRIRLRWILRKLSRRLRTLDPQTDAETKRRLLRLTRLIRRLLRLVILLLRLLMLLRDLIRLILRSFQRSERS
ncbi:MAG TPA: hypothetical protein DDW30_06325 [Clostridiales bacterium]|nr:hypothetical protein [Clostridiales bacterium]